MHAFRLRVYYEDTDLAGIVYYANYLKFIERGRTEALIAGGVDQARLQAAAGIVFAVRRVEADYLAPARLQDQLDVLTGLTGVGGARIDLVQEVRRGESLLFTARVRLAAIGRDGRPARVPAEVRAALAGMGAGPARP
jgi:acyl-CoA thioester hydrolase